MTASNNIDASGDNPLAIEGLPMTVLQSIYETVTGKTETMSETLRGNVVIHSTDIDTLITKIAQQFDLHAKASKPVTTIVVKHGNEKSVTYSSKERFDKLRIDHPEMTSEIQLKVEAVIRTPGTPKDQRIVINVGIDSSLPLLNVHSIRGLHRGLPMRLFAIVHREWSTVKVSIDFVDFLVGKGFASVVKEWFDSLPATPSSKGSERVLERFDLIDRLFSQFGKIGLGSFFVGIAFWSGADSLRLVDLFNSLGIALIIWAAFTFVSRYAIDFLYRAACAKVIPSVILLNNTDKTSYDKLINAKSSFGTALFAILVAAIGNIIINLGSSYLYDSKTLANLRTEPLAISQHGPLTPDATQPPHKGIDGS